MKKFTLSVILCCLGLVSFGATYYSKPSVTSLDATVLTNWSSNTGGTGSVPGSFTAGDSWVIQTAGGLTTSVGWILTGSITINAGITISVVPTITGTITIGSTGSLVLSTGSTVSAGGNITNNGVLNVGSGDVLDLGTTYTLAGTGTYSGAGTIKTSNTASTCLPSGKTWPGTVQYAAASGAQHIQAGTYNNLTSSNSSGTNTTSGIVTINGNLTIGAGTVTATYAINGSPSGATISGTLQTSSSLPNGVSWTGTVNYNGSSQTLASGTYNNLTVNSCTAAGAVTVNGTLTVNSSKVLDMSSYALTATGTITNNGTIQTACTGATPLPSGHTWSGIINYYGTGQTVMPGTYATLMMSNSSGTNNAGGNLVVNTKLQTTTGGTLAMGTNLLSGTLSTISNSGTIETSVPTTTSTTPIPSGKTWGGTILYDGASGNQTVVVATYNNLSCTGSVTDAPGGALVVNGAFTIGSGTTLNMSANKITGSMTSVANSGTLKTAVPTSVTNTPYPISKTWGGTVEFTATSGAQSVPGGTYNNLTFDNTSGTDAAIGNIVVTGALNTTSGGTFWLTANYTLDVTSATINNNGIVRTDVASTISATPLTSGKTWGGEVQYGLSSGTINVAGGTYNNLTIMNYANATGNVTVNGTLSVQAAGNFYMGTSYTLSGSLTTINLAGTFRTAVPTSVSSTPVPSGKNWSSGGGIFEYYASTGAQTIVAGTYGTIWIMNSASTTNTAGGNLVINGTLRYTTGGTLNMGSFTLTGTAANFSGNNSTIQSQNTSSTPFTPGNSWYSKIEYNNATGGQTIVTGTYRSLANSNTSGTNTLAGDITVQLKLTLNAGSALDNGGHTINLIGHIVGTGSESGSGPIALTPDSTSVNLDGATINSLTLNASTNPTAKVYLVGNLNVSGTLTLNGQGIILNGSNLSILDGGSLAGTFSASNMIETSSTGMLQLYTNGTGSLVFPVGDSFGNYTPMTLNMTGGSYTSGSAYVGVNVNNTKDPDNANASNYLNRYWDVVTSGITSPTYDLTSAQYVSGDVSGTESSIIAGQYTGSLPWSDYNAANTGTHVLSGTGLSGTNTSISGISVSAPTVTASPSSVTICNGSGTVLSVGSSTGDPTLTYSWAPSGSLSAATGTSVTASPTITQIYTLTVTDGNGNTAFATTTVTVENTPGVGTLVGTGTICTGSAATITDPTADPGGSWLSTNTAVATIDASTGIIAGLTDGTTTISYVLSNTCGTFATSSTETVASPTAITGTLSVCVGNTTTLSSTPSGSTWSSSATSVATVDPSTGVVTGVSGGTTTISYVMPVTGCNVEAVVTVNALPAVSFTAGPGASSCVSNNVTYTTQAGESGYIWTVPGVLNTDYSIISGGTSTSDNTVTLQWVTTGSQTVTINYTDANGCTATSAASNTTTAHSLPSVSFTSSPGANVCSSTDVTYTTQSGQSNYVWTVPGSLGVDYTISAGGLTSTDHTVTLQWLTSGSKTVTVNYNNSNGCDALSAASTTTNVNIRPSATFTSSPGANVCSATNVTYTTQSSESGYTWSVPGTLGTDYSITTGGVSSSDNTVTLQWLTTGSKTVTINYTDGNGCTSLSNGSSSTTVNSRPSVSFTASPTATTCSATNVTYTTQAGQTSYVWTVPGVLNTDYTITSGGVSTTDATVTLQWLTAGSQTVTVDYTNAGGCTSLTAASNTTTVNTRPTATFTSSPGANVCTSTNITYTTQGSESSYVWSVPGVLNTDYSIISGGIGSGSNTVVLQWLTSGSKTVTINYTDGNGCTSSSNGTNTTTSNTTPVASFTSSPTANSCSSNNVTYTTQSGQSSYVWSVPGVLNTDYSITSGGIGSGSNTVTLQWLTSGSKTVTVNYTNAGGCSSLSAASSTTSVHIVPSATFTSAPGANVCSSTDETYTTQGSESSYTWSVPGSLGTDYTISSGSLGSSSNTVTLQWLTSGSKTVTVNYTDGNGCTSLSNASNTTTSNLRPTASFTASPASSVCASTNETYTTQSGQSSYVWSVPGSLGTDYSITSGGIGSGSNTVTLQWLTSGSKTVTVNYNNASGCTALSVASAATSVNALPSVSFSSSPSATTCNSFNYTYTTQSGQSSYAWTVPGVLNTDYAIVSGGVSATDATVTLQWLTNGSKTVSINYNNAAGCSALSAATAVTSVNPLPNSITGTVVGCVGSTFTTADATGGGTWSISNTSLATIDASTGVITSIAAGTPVVSYTLGTGCYRTTTMTLKVVPSAISGSFSICPGSTTSLSDATSSGSWTSSNTGVATVGSSTGVVTGVVAGSATVTYNVAGCTATHAVTVTSATAPAAISGGNTGVCNASTLTLSDATGSGTWSSNASGVASVNSSGVVTAASVGNAVISYTLGSCYVTTNVTVNAVPTSISGSNTVCAVDIISLSDVTTGGTWSSDNTSAATISTSGVVTGVAAGTANISYTKSGCAATLPITVNANSLAAITGSNQVCITSSYTFTDGTGGGTWSSSATGVATINSSTGVVTPVSAGAYVVSYTLGSCYKTFASNIGASLPGITGSSSVCVGSNITLNDATTGGNWYSLTSSKATAVLTTGVITGVASGSAVIEYAKTGCTTTMNVTVVSNTVSSITGTLAFCASGGTTVSDVTSSGTWSVGSTSIATVNSSTGVVTGVGAGNTGVTYTVTSSGCFASATLTVNACREGNGETVNGGVGGTENATQVYTLYPNPSAGALNLVQSMVDNGNAKVRIYNYLGQIVYTGGLSFSGGTAFLTLNNAAPGMYIMEVDDASGNTQKLKFTIEQ